MQKAGMVWAHMCYISSVSFDFFWFVLQVGLSNGMQALVTKIDAESGITLDCNHELAGGPRVGLGSA